MSKANDKQHRRQQDLARLSFLDAASHLLIQACPPVSAHLGLERLDLVYQSKGELRPTMFHEVCGRCGIIAQPGNSQTFIESRSRKDQDIENANKTSRVKTKLLVTSCLQCGHISKSNLAQSARHKISKTESKQPVPELPVAHQPDGENKINRKQKQREKKKQGSLQAMLAKSKQQSIAASSGLNLMDLMKGL